MTPVQASLFSSMEPTTDVEGRRRMDRGREVSDAARRASRRTDPETSAAAYRDTAPRVEGHKKLVLDALRTAGEDGLTDHEAGAACGLIPTSAGKRRLDLMRDGLVVATDMRRPTPTGSMAAVWRAK